MTKTLIDLDDELGALARSGIFDRLLSAEVELQLLSAFYDTGTYATVAAMRQAAFPVLEMSEVDVRRALEIQALLVQCGVPWPTRLVAAIAERHGVTVLHANACFDVIAAITGQG
jgi:predicted nucleic acid-binding protein